MRILHEDCWKLELAIVCLVLAGTAMISGGQLTDWTCSSAVLFTFMHAQVSFDLQDAQENLDKPTVPYFKLVERYFFAKEALWIMTFTLLRAWPLLAGTIIFATYPKWRKWLRTRASQTATTPLNAQRVSMPLSTVGVDLNEAASSY